MIANKLKPIETTIVSDAFITGSMITGSPGELFVLDKLDVFNNTPERQILAGIKLDGVGYQVVFHYGFNEWCFSVDNPNKAVKYSALRLEQAIERFETTVGVKLPPVLVRRLGYGEYYAAEPDLVIPLELTVGEKYQVYNERGVTREFVVMDKEDGKASISFVSKDTGEHDPKETFDPLLVLTRKECEFLHNTQNKRKLKP